MNRVGQRVFIPANAKKLKADDDEFNMRQHIPTMGTIIQDCGRYCAVRLESDKGKPLYVQSFFNEDMEVVQQ